VGTTGTFSFPFISFLFPEKICLEFLWAITQCEDEAVDLRWQLLAANKEIKQLKKAAAAQGQPPAQPPSEQPKSESQVSQPASPTQSAPTSTRATRRAGLRSSKDQQSQEAQPVAASSSSKRKADDENVNEEETVNQSINMSNLAMSVNVSVVMSVKFFRLCQKRHRQIMRVRMAKPTVKNIEYSIMINVSRQYIRCSRISLINVNVV
jgi:hypothetical protein